MSRNFKQFIMKILAAAVLLIFAGWALFSYALPGKYIPVLPWMVAFFALATILIHGYQLRLAKINMAKFARSSMLVSILRLVLYSVFAIIYLAINSEGVDVFAASLVVVYLVFMFIEVSDISHILKQK